MASTQGVREAIDSALSSAGLAVEAIGSSAGAIADDLVTYRPNGSIATWTTTLKKSGETVRYFWNFYGNQWVTSTQKAVVATAERFNTIRVVGGFASGAITLSSAINHGDLGMGAAQMQFWALTMIVPFGPDVAIAKGIADVTGASAFAREAFEPMAQDMFFQTAASRASMYSFGPAY